MKVHAKHTLFTPGTNTLDYLRLPSILEITFNQVTVDLKTRWFLHIIFLFIFQKEKPFTFY